jgi:hypothetical protein
MELPPDKGDCVAILITVFAAAAVGFAVAVEPEVELVGLVVLLVPEVLEPPFPHPANKPNASTVVKSVVFFNFM